MPKIPIDALNVDELLALLFLCKTERMRGPVIEIPQEELLDLWEKHLKEFDPRLKYLSEDQKKYLIKFSHLQSTEELEIDSEECMKPILEKFGKLIRELANGKLKAHT